MKLKRLNQGAKTKKILIIVGVVLVLLAIALAILLIPKAMEQQEQEKNADTIQGITMNVLPETTYYVGQEFNPTGAKIQVIKGAQSKTQFLDASDVEFSGFDSSVAVEKQVITVTYQGFTTSFTVTIKDYAPEKPTVVSIEVCDMPTTYSRTAWNEGGPIIKSAYLKLTYSDGSVVGSYKETPLLYSYIQPYDEVASGTNKTYLTIVYNEGGIEVSTTVTITITE